MTRSAEATAIYDMFISTNAKAPWSEPEPFAQLVEACREEQRKEAQQGYQAPNWLADKVRVENAIANDTPMVTIMPIESDDRRNIRVLYFHGGAFFKRIGEEQWGLCADMVQRTGCTLTACMYPLAPTHTCQETYEAAYAAYERELALAKETNTELVLMGDSAGGAMCFAVAQMALARNAQQPARIVGISPFLDMVGAIDIPTCRNAKDPMIGWYGCQQIAAIWAADHEGTSFPPDPLYGPKEGLPEALIIVGEHEVMLSGVRKFAKDAEKAGCSIELHEFEGMWHIFPILGHLPEAQMARTMIARFISEGPNL